MTLVEKYTKFTLADLEALKALHTIASNDPRNLPRLRGIDSQSAKDIESVIALRLQAMKDQ